MANAMTEHSKKLRAKTASERNKRLRESGAIRQFGVTMATADADQLDAIAKELGLSRPQTIKALCDFYRQHTN